MLIRVIIIIIIVASGALSHQMCLRLSLLHVNTDLHSSLEDSKCLPHSVMKAREREKCAIEQTLTTFFKFIHACVRIRERYCLQVALLTFFRLENNHFLPMSYR